MSIQLQPSVSLVTLVKTESLTLIKIEPPEEALEKEISPDIKDIDIVYHSLSEDLIKSETVPETILETKYSKSVETQVLVKTEDTSDENVTKGTGQEVIEVQGSNEYSNVLGNLESDKQLVSYLSTDSNAFSTKNRKAKQPEKTNFAKCYKTVKTTSWKKNKEKIKVIKAPVIPVEAHEYTSLAQDRYVCNHCQNAYKALSSVRQHIKQMHRKLTTIYQCPYCPYYYKFKWTVKNHIILKHKDTKDIQWFQYGCNKCNYKSYTNTNLKRHNLVHLKPEDIEYFYCYYCSYKSKGKKDLREHIFRQHFKNVKQGRRHHCNRCDYRTYRSRDLKMHNLVHLKPEEIEYFYCYHCSYKSKHKFSLKNHIFIQHFKNVKQEKRFGCNKCDYKTYTNTKLKKHNLVHLNPEEIHYFYCYHCSYKAKEKGTLKRHIFIHFKKEQVKFDCYICNFMTPKRKSIIKHIKKHSKVQNHSEINDGS